EVNDDTTAAAVAYSVLGHTVKSDDRYAADISTCSDTATSPFVSQDIKNLRFKPPGRKLEYSKKVKVSVNVSLAVDADLKQLVGLASDKIAEAKAELTAAYQ